MPTYDCPRCQCSLDDARSGRVRVYPCARCGGHAMTLSQLRSVSETARFQAFWQAARAAPPALLTCPACRKQMHAAVVRGVEVDACITCHLVWLDPGEQEKLAGAPPRPPQPAGAGVQADRQLARQLLALDQAAAASQERKDERRSWRAWLAVELLLELLWWA